MNRGESRQNILELIRKEEIKPTPRWHFTLKTTGGWTAFLVAVLLGGLAFSVILYAIQQSEFSLTDRLGHSGIEVFLSLLPVIWLVFIGLFFLISIIGIRHSWKGYKIPLLKQFGWSIGLSMVVGLLFFLLGGGGWLDQSFGNTLTGYETIEERKLHVWSNPEQGYLSGTIVKVSSEQISIADFNEGIWNIDIKDSWIAPPVLMEEGERIKMLGEKIAPFQFKASEIRPWGGRQRMKNIENQ